MINILDYLFITLSVTLLLTGLLVNYFEKVTPKYLLMLWGYGCFSYKGMDIIKWIEVPKCYFRHFYIYATIICVFTMDYMLEMYGIKPWLGQSQPVCDYVNSTLMLLGDVKPVSVSRTILTMFLFTIHVSRRLFETCFLQVFAKTSKMNIVHYLMAFVHYTAYVGMIAGYAPLFSGCRNPDSIKWTDLNPGLTLPIVGLFILASIEQNRSNIILANLRKDRKGKVVSEEYTIPRGGCFDYVSSPHRLTEVIIYACLCILHGTLTSYLACLWVFINQTQISIKVHAWYLKEFDKYPKNRRAIIPFIL